MRYVICLKPDLLKKKWRMSTLWKHFFRKMRYDLKGHPRSLLCQNFLAHSFMDWFWSKFVWMLNKLTKLLISFCKRIIQIFKVYHNYSYILDLSLNWLWMLNISLKRLKKLRYKKCFLYASLAYKSGFRIRPFLTGGSGSTWKCI